MIRMGAKQIVEPQGVEARWQDWEEGPRVAIRGRHSFVGKYRALMQASCRQGHGLSLREALTIRAILERSGYHSRTSRAPDLLFLGKHSAWRAHTGGYYFSAHSSTPGVRVMREAV